MLKPDSPRLLVLDVGHGNCTILLDSKGVSVFDAPSKTIPLKVLSRYQVTEIASVVASHADKDHIEGLIAILANDRFDVRTVYVNPDASKVGTGIWRKFLTALDDARLRQPRVVAASVVPSLHAENSQGPPFHSLLTRSESGKINCGEVRVEVLYPRDTDVLRGQGGTDFAGRPQSSNTLSAVLRFWFEEKPRLILSGDIDETALENLLRDFGKLDADRELKADILVFPHHGGHADTKNLTEFARRLCNAVEPNQVLFSIGRNQHENPLQEIVEGVKTSRSTPRIVCTQLSPHCHPKESPILDAQDHLGDHPAKGKSDGSCCAGTLNILFNEATQIVEPNEVAHQRFVQSIPNALCRNSGNRGT